VKMAIERGNLILSRNATGGVKSSANRKASAKGMKTARAIYRVPIATTAVTIPRSRLFSLEEYDDFKGGFFRLPPRYLRR
jgi:hypothetical protein